MDRATSSTRRILVVDDDADLLRLMTIRFESSGYRVCAVDSAEKARAQLSIFRPHVVVTDLRMNGMSGMALYEEIQQRFWGLPVIILTAHGTIPDAVAATQKGVFSYLTKPFDGKVLVETVEQALQHAGEPGLREDPDGGEDWRAEIISRSQTMEALLQQARSVAATDVSILIQSQTGTGKELLARAIHKASARKNGPFLALNCAALPEALLESELFGHAKGAFTGASVAREGLFRAANGGTLFLDEIGDMPLAAQVKLLRVLEEQRVRPVGSTESVDIDVRVISATHQNLQQRVEEKVFREDLYYRLNVVCLELPPLAERREDIAVLAQNFCETLAVKHSHAKLGFSPEAMNLLISAPWPGNVRQLLNVVEQCAVLTSTPLISSSLVERALRAKPEKLLSLNEARNRFEQDYLVQLLQLTEGKVTLAARLADRNRSEFYNLMRRHGLDPALFRTDQD